MEDMVVTVVGNLTADPQTGSTHSGEAWTSFRIAHNRRRIDRATRLWVDAEPSFLRVTCYRALAVNALASFAKGDRVVVHGRLRIAQWTGADGHSQTTAQVDADALGHDLTWGTSAFTRVRRTSPEAEAWSAAADLSEAQDVTDDPSFDEFPSEDLMAESEAPVPGQGGDEADDARPGADGGGAPGGAGEGASGGAGGGKPGGGEPGAGGTAPAEVVSTVTAVKAQPKAPDAEREPARSRRR